MTEIVYDIQTEETPSSALALRLLEKNSLKPLELSAAMWRKQAKSAQELEAIEGLIKEEVLFQKSQGHFILPEKASFSFLHLSQNQASPLLKLLAPKLYFKGKQLVVDFFGKVEFYYRVTPLHSNKVKVEGRLKWRDQDIDISECEWIGAGKPLWFIRGISLKTISTDVSWKDLKRAYSGPFELEGVEKGRFFESIDQEDPDAPKIVSSDTSWQKDPDPLPLLILKDRSGAFANLWMDYGDGHRIPYEDTRQDIKVDDGSFLFRRSKEAEKNWEKDLLETDFIKKIVGSSHYYCPLDKVAKSLTFLLEIGWNIQDGQGNQLKKAQTVQMAFDQYDERTLRVKGKVQYAEHEADVADVLGAFNRRERFIQLAPGSIGLLPADAGQMGLQELAQEGEIVGKEIQVKKSRFGSISHLLQDTSTVSPAVQNWMEKLKQFNRIEKALPTPDFKGQLRPYQQQGLDWLNFLVEYGFHGILADDMGLGKTVQVLALLSRLPRTWPHLIVVPTSLLFNWQREIEKFLPDLPVYLHHSSQRFKTAQELGSCSLILTSYTTLRLDLSLFKEVAFYSIILDEAQVIKNAHTQIAQAVFALQGQFRLSITGTPLENHLGELWSHFRFLMPDLFDNEETFLADLQAASVDQRHLQRIKKKIAPFILRRKKEEVAPDLPARIDQTVWVEMSDSQRQVYDQFLMGVKNQLLKKVELDGLKAHRMEVLEAILRLRQICCHPLLVSSALEESAACSSAKIDRLWQDIETILEEGKKVLIYSQFTSMLKWMAKEAKVREWNFAYLDGSTANREKVVSSFQEYPSISLFFISLKAGGVGLNLTAADYVFLFDPWWNEAVEEQAINRAHRIGRQETVIAKRLLVLESIEEKMMKLKAAKKELVEDLFDTEAIPSQLTLEDLRFLLS